MKFNAFVVTKVGDFDVAEAVCQVGERYDISFSAETPTNKMPAINLIMAGRFSYGPMPDASIIEMSQGYSSHLNAVRPIGDRAIISLEDGSIYLCLSSQGKPYGTRRIELSAGQSAVIRQGATFAVAKGGFSANAVVKSAPLVAHALSGPVEIIASSDFVAVEMWLQ